MQLLTYGRRLPFAELFHRIDAVDASTIKRVANRFIYDRVSHHTAEGVFVFFSAHAVIVFDETWLCYRILQLLPWVQFRACLTTTGSGAGPTGTDTRAHPLSLPHFSRWVFQHWFLEQFALNVFSSLKEMCIVLELVASAHWKRS